MTEAQLIDFYLAARIDGIRMYHNAVTDRQLSIEEELYYEFIKHHCERLVVRAAKDIIQKEEGNNGQREQ